MYDSIDISQIPPKAQAVAGYVGGKWPTYAQLVKEFPDAHKLSIAVNSSEDADCLDIETGDASVADAKPWAERQVKRGVHRPVFYTSLSNVNLLVQTLTAGGWDREAYRLWVAHYTAHAHLCGPSEGISVAADATQYNNRALGRNLDVSLCADDFFGSPVPPSNFVPADEARWEREHDALAGKRGPWPALRRRVLRRVMLHRQRKKPAGP